MEDRGSWHAAVHGVSRSQTRLSNWTIDNSKYKYIPCFLSGKSKICVWAACIVILHSCVWKDTDVFTRDRLWAGGLGVISLQRIPLYSLWILNFHVRIEISQTKRKIWRQGQICSTSGLWTAELTFWMRRTMPSSHSLSRNCQVHNEQSWSPGDPLGFSLTPKWPTRQRRQSQMMALHFEQYLASLKRYSAQTISFPQKCHTF